MPIQLPQHYQGGQKEAQLRHLQLRVESQLKSLKKRKIAQRVCLPRVHIDGGGTLPTSLPAMRLPRAPASTAPGRNATPKPPKETDCTQSMSAHGTQRWGGTFPTSPPVLRLPRGKMNQTSQTRTELPKLVKSESEGGEGERKVRKVRAVPSLNLCV